MRRANTLLFLAALLVAALGQTSQAADITWDGDTSSDWTDGANWVGGVAPADDTTTDVAVFSSALTPFQPSLATARSVGGLTFSNLTGGWNLSGAGTLTIAAGSTNTAGPLKSLNTSGTNTISLAGLVIGGNSPTYGLTIQMGGGSSANFVISSVISGTEGINKNSTGVLTLSGLNTFTGHTWLQNTTMVVNTLADYGSASSMGAETNAGLSEIYMGGSTGSAPVLRYIGTGSSTNRHVNLEGSAATTYTFIADGTGPVTFSGDFTPTTSAATVRTIALRGTNTGDNTISGVISNSISSPNFPVFGITKSEAGKWILSGNNTYTGPTTVNGGTLVLNGTNAYTATTTVNGAGAALVLGASGAIGSGNALTVTNGTVDIASFNQTAGAVTLTAGNITGTSGVLTGTSFSVNNAAASLISANLAGAAAMSKTLTGVLTLSGANTYTGKTSVNGGEVQYNSIANVGGGASALGAPTTAGNGTIDLGSSAGTTLTYTGPTASTDRVLNLAGTGSVFLSASGSGPITFTSDPTATGSSSTHRFALRGTNTGNNTISGVISDGTGPVRMDKLNPGKWVLTGLNTFSGSTATAPSVAVGEGTLEFNSIRNVGAGASALGAPTTVFAGTILLGSFTVNGAGTTAADLRYTGSGHSTDRVVDLSGSTGPVAIYANGSGPLTFTSAFTASQTTTPGAKTLTLRGTNTGDNTVGGAIVDGAGTTSLTKDDAGKWILGGVNTYTGATTVTAGTLLVNGSLAAGSAVAVNGGVLGGTGTINGAVTVAAAARLAPGASPGPLTLNNSLTLADGALFDFELATVGASDKVAMSSSTLNLNGQEFADFSFTPLGGFGVGTYTLFDAGGITGALGAGVSGTVGGLSSTLAISGNDLVLKVVPPGDHNGDSQVDARDYVLWRKSNINGAQGYTDWRTHFGEGTGGNGGGNGLDGAVPEPAAGWLMLTAIPGAGFLRRRR